MPRETANPPLVKLWRISPRDNWKTVTHWDEDSADEAWLAFLLETNGSHQYDPQNPATIRSNYRIIEITSGRLGCWVSVKNLVVGCEVDYEGSWIRVIRREDPVDQSKDFTITLSNGQALVGTSQQVLLNVGGGD